MDESGYIENAESGITESFRKEVRNRLDKVRLNRTAFSDYEAGYHDGYKTALESLLEDVLWTASSPKKPVTKPGPKR